MTPFHTPPPLVWLSTLFLFSSSSLWLPFVVEGGQSSYHQNPLGGNNGTSSPLCWGHWQSVGPFHVAQTYPGINDLTDPEDIGSASDIWLNGSTAYLASVNGGIWRTNNISGMEAYGGPHWEALTDHMPCTSISAISGSKDDSNIIVAGCGFPSNADGRGSEPLGVMISKDGGTTWNMTTFPRGYWVSDVLVTFTTFSGYTSVIYVSGKEGILVKDRFGNTTDPYGIGNSTGGIWRSSNGGATFAQVYSGSVNRIAQDIRNTNTFYATLLPDPNQSLSPLTNQIPLIKSTNGGLTWSPLLPPDFSRQCPGRDRVENSQLTINWDMVFVGFYLTQSNSSAGVDSSCYAFFRLGETWYNVLGAPSQDSIGSLGSSGSTHFTILAVPTAPDTLFVAGSGHAVYRVNTTTNEWTLISTIPGLNTTGVNATQSGTAPHADANRFEWNAVTNELLLTNGGSVYRRTNPFGAPDEGDWFSLSGDLAITEIHSFSLSPLSGGIILASQDSGFMMSQFDGTEMNSGMWSFMARGPGDWTGYDGNYGLTYGADRNLFNFFGVVWYNSNPTISHWNSQLNQDCFIGRGNCPHSTLALLDQRTWQLQTFVICTGGSSTTTATSSSASSPTVCYNLRFGSTLSIRPLEFNSTAFDLNADAPTAIDVLVVGGGRATDPLNVPVLNGNVIFAAGVGYTWSRDVPCRIGNTTCISVLDQCILSGDGCNMHNFVNRRPPWSATGKPLRLVEQNKNNYYVNIVVDGIGHIYLTNDFGRSYIDLNLAEYSNLFNISGHTSVDTFSTGGVMIFPRTITPYLITSSSPHCILVGTGNGIFITFDDPATASYFTFHRFGAHLPNTVVTSFGYLADTDTLYVSTLGRGLWTLQDATILIDTALQNQTTDHLNLACLRPLYPNVPNAYGYIPPPGQLPNDIDFAPKELIVWGVQDMLLGETLTIWISTTPGLAPSGRFTIQPMITTPGDYDDYFSPTAITVDDFSIFSNYPQSISFVSTGRYVGEVNFTTLLLDDFSMTRYQPYSASFKICNRTCSSPSSSSSSTGVESSSSTGSSIDMSSSTGSSDPLNVTVPTFLPSFTISLLPTTPNHTSPDFRTLLSSDLSQVCGVDSNRILILTKVDGSNSIDITFTITPLLLTQPTLQDLNATIGGDLFLVMTAWAGANFFTLPIGQYAIVGSGVLTPYPSNAISQLQQVSFGLNYDINNIPGGNTIKSFSSLILADVAAACSIPVSRLYMLSITAGSIQASFTISPNITTDEPSAAEIIQTFLSESQNPNSLLYSGATTSATIQGSTTVGVPGSSTPLPDDTPSNSNRRLMLIGIGCGIGGGVLLCCLILICCRQKRINSISSSSGNGRTKGGVYTPSMLGQPPSGGSMELSEIAVQTSPNQYAPLQ